VLVAFLVINAVLYAGFALWCAIRPHTTARFLGLELVGIPGLSEYTAVYGGLEAGMAVFFALAAWRPELRPAGLLFAICLYAGLVLFRTTVVVRHGTAIGNTMGAYALELLFLVWAVGIWIRLER